MGEPKGTSTPQQRNATIHFRDTAPAAGGSPSQDTPTLKQVYEEVEAKYKEFVDKHNEFIGSGGSKKVERVFEHIKSNGTTEQKKNIEALDKNVWASKIIWAYLKGDVKTRLVDLSEAVTKYYEKDTAKRYQTVIKTVIDVGTPEQIKERFEKAIGQLVGFQGKIKERYTEIQNSTNSETSAPANKPAPPRKPPVIGNKSAQSRPPMPANKPILKSQNASSEINSDGKKVRHVGSASLPVTPVELRQLKSFIQKYNEFVDKRNKFLDEHGGAKNVTISTFFKNDKTLVSNWVDNFVKLKMGEISNLSDCVREWQKIIGALVKFLPSDYKTKYEDAVKTICANADVGGQKAMDAVRDLRFLARKILKYMQATQEKLSAALGGEVQDDGTSIEKYAELDVDTDGKVKTQVAEVTKGVKESFKKVCGEFTKDGNSFKVSGVTASFNLMQDGLFRHLLYAALKNNKLKTTWATNNDNKLSEVEKEKRATMGVLFISMTYFKNSADVVNACKGLKEGGLKSQNAKNDTFIENAVKVRKAIQNAALGGVTGENLILKAVVNKAKDSLEYFIKDANSTVAKEIIDKFNPPLTESYLKSESSSSAVGSTIQQSELSSTKQSTKKSRSLAGRAFHKVKKRAGSAKDAFSSGMNKAGEKLKSVKKVASSRIKGFFGKSSKKDENT